MRSVLDLGRGTPRKQHWFGCFHELVFVRDVLGQCLCLERGSGKTSAQVFPREPRSWNRGGTATPTQLPGVYGTARARFHSVYAAGELEVRKGHLIGMEFMCEWGTPSHMLGLERLPGKY